MAMKTNLISTLTSLTIYRLAFWFEYIAINIEQSNDLISTKYIFDSIGYVCVMTKTTPSIIIWFCHCWSDDIFFIAVINWTAASNNILICYAAAH